MSKIIIVDDDTYIRELVCTLLRSSGFDVCEANDGRDALTKMTSEDPDLAIIDVMMPNMDGYELCRHLRRYYENLPILMLTAKGELGSKVKGFELGADDYLTKPFEAPELVARAKALLRRYKIEASQVIKVGGVIIDRNGYSVTVGAARVDIPMKEFELLFKLAGFPGRTFSRDQLIEDIWGLDFDGNERTLDVHIGRLRERFPSERSGFKITTVRGLGYRLEALQNEAAAPANGDMK
jgi:DNA-binding response OmpR family regulator